MYHYDTWEGFYVFYILHTHTPTHTLVCQSSSLFFWGGGGLILKLCMPKLLSSRTLEIIYGTQALNVHWSINKVRFFHQSFYGKNKFLPSSFQKVLRLHSVTVALEYFPSPQKSNHCLKMQSSGWKVEVSPSCSLEFLCWQICPATKAKEHMR